ncbi:Protein of unknown function [Cotesia congregata]|uniref:Uncharacterized protein n=1 Tax=Cotesia congregata TaxID=51543 RepID=A0A8J2HER4_COTCN|nr:Protein of unknown function [Cotesia congregata]
MEANPGLLYDPFKKIHLIREEWQLINSINVEKLVNLYPDSHQNLWESYRVCSVRFNHPNCMSYLRINSYREIRAEIEQGDDEIFLRVSTPGSTTSNPTSDIGQEGDDKTKVNEPLPTRTDNDNSSTAATVTTKEAPETIKTSKESKPSRLRDYKSPIWTTIPASTS